MDFTRLEAEVYHLRAALGSEIAAHKKSRDRIVELEEALQDSRAYLPAPISTGTESVIVWFEPITVGFLKTGVQP